MGAHGGTGEGAARAERGKTGQRPPPSADEEGFQEVIGRAARRRASKLGGWRDGDVRADAMDVEEARGTTGSWAQEDEEGNYDYHDGGDAYDDAWDDEEPGGGQERDRGEDDPAALRKRLDAEQATVRALQRQGLSDTHPAMAAAVATRDDAEAAWKSSRAPHPVARRMGWAQRRLDKALRSQARVYDELTSYDAQVQEQRAKIVERLQAAKERVSKHRQALDELQDEAANDAPGNKSAAEVCAKLAGGMRSSIAPEVEALAARIQEGSAAQLQLNLLVAQLQNLQGELDQLAKGGARGAVAYDIAGDDGDSDAGWSESHDLPAVRGDGVRAPEDASNESAVPPQWQPKGHGRWNKSGGGEQGASGKGQGASDGGAAKGVPTASAAAEAQATAAEAKTQTGSSGAKPQGDAPNAARVAVGRGDGEGEDKPNKFRRGQALADSTDAAVAVRDTTRALELMQSQRAIAAAGALGTDAAIQAAAQVHTQNVARVVNAALAQGIQPITSAGDDLITLGPLELTEWARANLASEDGDGPWW